MNRNEALAIAAEKLEEILRGPGFTRGPGSEYFTRVIPRGRQAIGMAVWDRSFGVELALLVKVRLDDVEDVAHLFSGTPVELRGHSSTIVTGFEHFSGGPSTTSCSSPEELRATLDDWEGVFRSKVLPYFEKAVDVIALDQLVNHEDPIPNITLPPHCYISQIILARLAGNPRFDDLAVDHVDRLIRGQDSTELYEAVLDYLESLPT